jgi:hypothetical protein
MLKKDRILENNPGVSVDLIFPRIPFFYYFYVAREDGDFDVGLIHNVGSI